jgi:septum site-determining protein MinC
MSQVQFQARAGQLQLLLPPETTADMDWLRFRQELQQRLSAGERFWQPQTSVHLVAGDRLLDSRHLQTIADLLAADQLQLRWVHTSRRQTAVAAAAAGYCVEQSTPNLSLTQAHTTEVSVPADPLYLQTTIRSGVEIRHPGTVVVLGDLNPGGVVIAEGDILVWGRLRGIAHAGARGNRQCRIMALQMEPTQLRIADQVARAPATPLDQFYPEVAQVIADGIQIVRASDVVRDSVLPLPKPHKSF